jgi:hypothetical protein
VRAAPDRAALCRLPPRLQLVELELGPHEHDVRHRLAEVGRRIDALLRRREDPAGIEDPPDHRPPSGADRAKRSMRATITPPVSPASMRRMTSKNRGRSTFPPE